MKNDYKVVKRSGEVVPFQIEKIRNVIQWAVDGLNINPLQLESSLEMNLKSKMTSKEIHQSVINTALKLTSLEQPEWTTIAARLKVISMYKDASQSRDYTKFGYDNYLRFLKQAWKLKIYDEQLKEKYSDEELKEAGKMISPAYDRLFDYAGINSLDHKYLMKHDNKVFELPQEMFLTIALYIEQNQPKKVRLEKVLDTYTKIATRKISLATPILLNLRKPHGNLSSCFITAMDDDLLSIYYVLEQCARISQNGGGVGINVSRVRSLGSYIQGQKNASGGVIPWIRLINDTATAVNQLGKRPGAMTVSLDIWHRDIESFLELQTENGDQRTKAMDIHPQVVISDEFMKRVENDDYWYMFDPHEIKSKFNKELVLLWGDEFTKFYNKLISIVEGELDKHSVAHKRSSGKDFEHKYEGVVNDDNKSKVPELVKKIKAKELLKHIMKSLVETGKPYISFKDTINRYNPNKDSGIILGGNLCMESFSNTSPSKVLRDMFDKESGSIVRKVIPGDLHTCNLCSVNMAFTEDHELEDVCATSVRILDNLIDFTTAPVQEGMLHNNKYRTIGVGFMGYADYTVKKGLAYSQSAELANSVFEDIGYYCTKASMELAKERGSFETFDQSEFKKGIILGKDKEWFQKNAKSPDRWVQLIKDIKEHGIRNSQITAIAPNTSTSLLQGCTASILPIYGKFYFDNGKTTVPILPPFINTDTMWTYQENKNIDQKHVVEVTSQIQKWIDTGISMELLLNPNLEYVNAKYFYKLIMDSWKKECKTIYYVRSIQKGNDLEKGEESCSSCAG